ncbi:MAG TPA: hypothetical protein PLY30_00625 [Candidatus Omnitrophota bacterium]|nr:hypothetical protein [Candidatus Omnitrophota bacterium]
MKPIPVGPELMRMFHELHIEQPVPKDGPETSRSMMIKILDHDHPRARHARHLPHQRLRVRHMM